MRQGDLSPVVATLVEAADPEKVSAAALAAYALEASQAPAAREIALVASLAPTPLDQPEVVGVVGVLLADDLFPSEMRIKGSDAAYVTNLAVASRARRRGIANDLLHSAERFASESGRSTVWCRVDDDNDVARGFYKRRGYAPREPPKLVKYRDVVSSAYGFAGLAHFIDLVFLNSTVAVAAGAPAFWEMTGLEKTLALVWCAFGPLATAANFLAKKKNAPSVAVAGLVAYGAFETLLACSCALLFGARGGDAATGAVAVQAVVLACYRALAPGARGGKISLAKTVEPSDERFYSLFLGFRVAASRSDHTDATASTNAAKNLTTRSDAIRWRTLDDAREEDGWVADLPEPSPTQSADFSDVLEDYERDSSGRVVYAARGFFYDGVRPSDAVDFGMTERVKVGVGIVGKKRERVFALRKVLGSRGGVAGVESDVFAVTMDRPLGVVVERDVDGRVRVADFVEGSRAGRAAAVAQLQGLNENSGARAARRGDVIRAFTTTTLSYGPRAQLLGDLSGTKRAVVLFGADDQPWGKTIGALKSGLVADGPVTLILERDRDAARAEAWTPEPTPPPEVEKKKSAAPVSSRSIEGAEKRKALRTVGSPSVDDRERVSQAPSVVPDPVNASLLVAGVAFVALVVTGFS
jgi:ribosomal protein S18 acetylase RimI-like enzyme